MTAYSIHIPDVTISTLCLLCVPVDEPLNAQHASLTLWCSHSAQKATSVPAEEADSIPTMPHLGGGHPPPLPSPPIVLPLTLPFPSPSSPLAPPSPFLPLASHPRYPLSSHPPPPSLFLLLSSATATPWCFSSALISTADRVLPPFQQKRPILLLRCRGPLTVTLHFVPTDLHLVSRQCTSLVGGEGGGAFFASICCTFAQRRYCTNCMYHHREGLPVMHIAAT